MNRPRSGTSDNIKGGLKICSMWVHDGHGDAMKDCGRCPYHSDTDPCGMNCGERLMHDADLLIAELEKRIEELEGTVRKLSHELANMSQREYN